MSSIVVTNRFDEHWLSGPQSTKFYCRAYTSATPRAILVFLHGFIEHVGRYAHVFPLWQARGIHVFALDQRGFGRTAADKERRSTDSAYGKTSGEDQLEDAAWAIQEAKRLFGSELPVFLMGHSMGGGIVLDFASRAKAELAGVIASSPLILQTSAAPKIARWVGGKVSILTPYSTIPAQVKAKDLSRDPESNEAYLNDPLIEQKGTLRGISDMLNRGEELLNTHYKDWHESLPLFIAHGTDDKVTSHAASKLFYDAVSAKDKQISLYPGGLHELHNEPDGMKERFINECIAWVEARLPKATPASRL
ncbi:lysophospholipase [Phellopilus nigrolimitatus]|nr:lysophospholipase [Phellopilus nigrolimitatus]